MDVSETISGIAARMWESGGEAYAKKLEELQDKMQEGRLNIAFCGHFSAGKSTLINRICGHRLLPSGPIPTSANVVHIRNGEPGARIWRRKGNAEMMVEEAIPLNRLERACKDGSAVETVEIRYPIALLRPDTVLLDTPGIDSTDEAHQAATESALHLADVVFYVMDYNYVQSEVNFAFAKRLQDSGKPLYLIVNQIDKHREQELPFEAYRQSVVSAFRNWQIEPAGLLFLSLKDELHPHNNWNKLLALINAFEEDSAALRAWSLKRSVKQIIREYMSAFRESREMKKNQVQEAALDDVGTHVKETSDLSARLGELDQLANDRREAWKKEAYSIIENANLMPAATRDLAGLYLESRKPGFRIGFIGRTSKTEAEQEKRLAAFREDTAERAKAHLYWHIADLIKREADILGFQPSRMQEALDAFKPEVTAEWLKSLVHPGAEYSGEYTLQYCRQVDAEIKAKCRKETNGLLELLSKLLSEHTAEERRSLEAERDRAAKRLSAIEALERLERQETEEEEQLLRMADKLSGDGQVPVLPDPAELEVDGLSEKLVNVGFNAWRPSAGAEKEGALKLSDRLSGTNLHGAPASKTVSLEERQGKPEEFHALLQQASEKLKQAAQLLAGLEGMAQAVQNMESRAEKLAKNRFTIALFGAFSAGKSSFANALMGSRILPVSPNPTTAAINTILPPDGEAPHGTVKVTMKSEETIREEVLYSLQALGIHLSERVDGWKDNFAQIGRNIPEEVPPAGRPHLAFLKAVEKGFQQAVPHMGTVLYVDLSEFAGYAADEAKAIFVSQVELHYSTPLTEQGVVLVDTPGADSINSRHTGVAFNYIKNADAILFVTYYNHAFSQADREFLFQLGRVKDSLELDKMFFLVNAADLASGKEELEDVLRHVGDNLVRYGIRHPRIFPVSSQMAVEAKLRGDADALAASGFSSFERELQRFAGEELAASAVQGAMLEILRATLQLDGWLAEAKRDAGERSDQLKALEAAWKSVESSGVLLLQREDQEEMMKELEELLYYVKQRAMHRFGEFFRSAFSSSALREDLLDLKTAMQTAWQELLRTISFSLSQEVLAVTLRTEQFINRRLKRKWEDAGSDLEGILPGYKAEPFEECSFATPEVEEAVVAPEPEGKWLLGFYRNGRQFFEGDGKAKLQAALEAWLTEPIQDYISLHFTRLSSNYALQLETVLTELRKRAMKSADGYCSGLRAVWSETADLEALLQKRELLEDLLHNKNLQTSMRP